MSVLAHPISDHHADPDIYPIRIAELPGGTTLNGVYLVYRRTQVELVPLVVPPVVSVPVPAPESPHAARNAVTAAKMRIRAMCSP